MHTKIVLIASLAALSLGGCDQPDTDLGERESETNGGSDSATSSTGGTTGEGTSEGTSTGELPQETGEASGEPPQETGESGGPAVECAPLTTEASYADECRAEFCPDVAVIDFPSDGQGFECSDFGCATGPEGEFLFFLVQGQASISLTFAASLADDGYSTEAFNANFLELNGLVEVPSADGNALQVIPVQTPSFTYEDGVLDFALDVGVENAWYTIESDAKDCISDDILGECPCFYAGDAELEVVVAASVEEL